MPSARPGQFALTTPGPLRLYSTSELLCLPPPAWLVKDVIPTGPQGSFTVLYGPSGAGKSFVALDLALSVASGIPWQGKTTEPGPVVYVSAEGTAGLGQRILAWLKGNGLDASDVNISWLMEALTVYSASEELDQLLRRFDELAESSGEQPTMVIIDTLARCFEGDENATEDMSNFVKGVDRIRMDCGSAVVAIHHTNSGETRERGNNSLRAATDTMILVQPGAMGVVEHNLFTVTCRKQKEAAPFTDGVGQLLLVDGTTSARPVIDWKKELD